MKKKRRKKPSSARATLGLGISSPQCGSTRVLIMKKEGGKEGEGRKGGKRTIIEAHRSTF